MLSQTIQTYLKRLSLWDILGTMSFEVWFLFRVSTFQLAAEILPKKPTRFVRKTRRFGLSDPSAQRSWGMGLCMSIIRRCASWVLNWKMQWDKDQKLVWIPERWSSWIENPILHVVFFWGGGIFWDESGFGWYAGLWESVIYNRFDCRSEKEVMCNDSPPIKAARLKLREVLSNIENSRFS